MERNARKSVVFVFFPVARFFIVIIIDFFTTVEEKMEKKNINTINTINKR